ncbi:MAG: ferric reductase-like transmembrane domain-containing protein [Burkholderiaceae bacterium]
MLGPLFRRRPIAIGGFSLVLAYLVSRALTSPWPIDFKAWRAEGILFSGILLIAAMAAAALLALRPATLEPRLGGLDRLYGLHKQLGIAVCALLAIHWLADLSPKILVALDLMTPRVKSPKPTGPVSLIASLRGPAKDLGEWAAWSMVLLLPLALWGKAIAYGLWRHVHKIFALVLVAGVFHSALLMPLELWASPVGAATALALSVASVAALLSLTGRIGARRTVRGEIVAAQRLNPHTIELRCRLAGGWRSHSPGQFALLTLDPSEGAHPYTMASADRGDGEVSFVIKALGDYTRRVVEQARPGQPVSIEGPYGRFDLPADDSPQVWIAGGIGVTPFMAWLDQLSLSGQSRRAVDFFWCVSNTADAVRLDWLRERAAASGVRLHLIDAARQEFLSAEHPVFAGRLEQRQVWFCGPAGLAKALSAGLAARGLPPSAFHTEAFGFR